MASREALPGYTPRPQEVPDSSTPAGHRRFLPSDGDESEPLQRSPPLSPGAELPPAYTAHNENVSAFSLDFPFVLATSPAVVPRYQLFAEYSRTGKPQKLQIRRLLITESRRLSSANRRLSAISSASSKSKLSDSEGVNYDQDTTLYTVQTDMIVGRRARTLTGHVKIERGGGKCRFWHMTRNEAGDSLRKENERKLQKYGYHSKNEWNKILLYEVSKSKWKDPGGSDVATESSDGLEIVTSLNVLERDLLVTCWVSKRWYDDCKKFRGAEGANLTLR